MAAIVEHTQAGPVLTVSKADVAELGLTEGSELTVSFVGENVIFRPIRKYTLDELLAECDFSQPMSEEDREWVNAPRVGRELI